MNEHEHNFFELDREQAYYKEDGGRNWRGKTYDHSVSYQMLACKCGETKEIVYQDHRKST